MRLPIGIVVFCAATFLWPGVVTGEEKSADRTRGLVDAAKEAKAKRKKSSGKVITNADVKKSKGKIIILPAKKDDAEKPSAKRLTLAEMEVIQHAKIAASQRVAAAEKQVSEVEKELQRLEYRYYEENDPNYRDDVIQQRFSETQKKLDEARREVSAAQDALKAIDEPAP